MSLSSLFLLIGLLYVGLDVLLCSVLLWGSLRCWKVPGAGFRPALRTVVILRLCQLVVFLAVLSLFEFESRRLVRWLAVSALLVSLTLPWLFVWWQLRIPLLRSALVVATAWIPMALISIVVALPVRTYLAEPYVSPAGSMAPAIYGRNLAVTCHNCGNPYIVNASSGLPDRLDERDSSRSRCGNCGHGQRLPDDPPIRTGDRFLVDKTTTLANRWELIVFRSPEGPNFVKRLIGLPGERIAITGGEIFVDGNRLQKGTASALDLWIPVHDTAYRHQDESNARRGWEPVSANNWRRTDEGWYFQGPRSTGELYFRGGITDELDFNSLSPSDVDQLPVGDIQVEFSIGEFKGDGSFGLEWDFGGLKVRFEAATSGDVAIRCQGSTGGEPRGIVEPKENGGLVLHSLAEGSQISFSVRDGQAFITQDSQTLAELDLVSPRIAVIPHEACDLRVFARDCEVEFSRIRLHRDVYYRTLKEMDPFSPDGQESEIRLGRDEHFVLGDNSGWSKDSRFIGPIKHQALVGVARWRYWPLHRMGAFR